MGKPTGFIEIHRKKAPTRPVEERVHDYREVYLPYPTEELQKQGARCMDCGIPFCHQGCPLGNLIPDWNDLVYRDRWQPAIDRLHATNNFPEWTGRLVPGAVRRLVRPRHQRRSRHDQVDRSGDHRARVRRGLGVSAPAARAHRKERGRDRVGARRAGGRRSAEQGGPRRDRLRKVGPHRRAAALRHSRVQDGEALPEQAPLDHGAGRRGVPHGRQRGRGRDRGAAEV